VRNSYRDKLSLALPASVFLFFAVLETVDTIGFEPTFALEAESLAQPITDVRRPAICGLKQGDDDKV
jgi:hypothetical protein